MSKAGLVITLRFVREAGFLSWLIDRGTGGFIEDRGPRFSHVGVIVNGRDVTGFGLEPDEEYEFGARSDVACSITGRPGVQFRRADYAQFVAQDRVRIPVTAKQRAELWDCARRINGADYSIRTIASFVLGEELLEGRGKFICSQAAALLLLRSGVLPPQFRGWLREISPNSLYIAALAIDGRRRITG